VAMIPPEPSGGRYHRPEVRGRDVLGHGMGGSNNVSAPLSSGQPLLDLFDHLSSCAPGPGGPVGDVAREGEHVAVELFQLKDIHPGRCVKCLDRVYAFPDQEL